MTTIAKKIGFTLVEMLIVIAVIVVLTALTVGIAKRVEDQGKERLTKATLGIIDAAMEQFADYNYKYNGFYAGLKFPIDCNGFSDAEFQTGLEAAINVTCNGIDGTSNYDPNFSGISIMYFLLNQVPECRETLRKIDSSLLTDKDKNKQRMYVVVDFGLGDQQQPLVHIDDAWGKPLRYDYYNEEVPLWHVDMRMRNFPLVTSAGPDKKFDTDDDITNEE